MSSGARHEISPPRFSAVRSEGSRTAGRPARCNGSKLSVAADHNDCTVSCRWRSGRDRAHYRGAHARAARTTDHDREYRRSRRKHRRRPYCSRAARWLHDFLGIDATFVLNSAFYALPYDVLNDFTPISPLAVSSIVLVARKTLPAEHLSELIDWLKAHPNQASAGMNTLSFRLLAMRFQRQTGTQFNIIPYRAVGAIIGDLVAGQIDLAFGTLTTHLPQLRAGSEKAYAVAGETRSALAPDIPTFAEMGLPGLTYSSWYGVFAPRDTPKDIVGKLNAAIVQALGDPMVQSRIVDLGFEAFPRERQTPETLAAMQKADAEKWLPLIKEFGIKAE